MTEAGNAMAQRVAGALLAVLGLVVGYGSRDLEVIEEGVPGPGLLPMAMAVALVVLGTLMALRAAHEAEQANAAAGLDREALVRIGLALLCLFAYVVAVPYLGYSLATLGFCFVLLSAVASYSLVQRALASAGVTLVMYVVFDVLLNVGLPSIGSLFA